MDLKSPSFYQLTSTLRLLALRGLRTLRVRRVSLRAPGVTQSNIFWDFFPLYKYFKQRSTKNFSYGSENIILEIYSTKNPMSTVGSYSLAYFCNLFTLCIYCKQK